MTLRLLIVLIIAFILTIIPMPDLLQGVRPPWVLLFVLYLQFFLPRFFNLIFLFLVGLCLDVLLAATLGEHAFALLITTWIASGKTRRFNFFSMGQQISLIAFYCLTYQLLILLINAFSGFQYNMLMAINSAVLCLFLWPWLKFIADKVFKPKIMYR